MAMSLSSQLSSTPGLDGIVSIDAHQRIQIVDQLRAFQILAQSDANSPEYKIITIAMQCSNLQRQAELADQLNLSKTEIVRLTEENRKIADELTTKQMKEDSDSLRLEERNQGIQWIAFGVLFPPAIIPGLGLGIPKLIMPGSEAMSKREEAMEFYKIFHPNASLTECYQHVKETPVRYNLSMYRERIEEFREQNPGSTYSAFIQSITQLIDQQVANRKPRNPHRIR